MIKKLLVSSMAASFLAASAFANEVAVVCSKDMRAVDGPLVTYTLLKNSENNTYSLLEQSSAFSFTGEETKTSNVLEEGMTCSLAEDLTFQCARDLRPVDGPFNKFTLSKNTQSKFSLVQHSTTIDMRTGNESSSATTLSDGLICK